MKKLARISAGAIAAIAVGIFVALAQSPAISVPYLTPMGVKFSGLGSQYPVNGPMNYSISLEGYGSNCIDFRAEVIREPGERVAYFAEVQDCRKIEIAQGPYGYTKNFEYEGAAVLGRPGGYAVVVGVLDPITGQTYNETRSFIVVEESS